MISIMSKALISIFLILIFSNIAFSGDYSFRNTKWGMSEEDVKSAEPLKIVKDEGATLVYKTKILDKNVYIIYIFSDNKLVRSKYLLAERHSNRTDFINDYKDFKKILTKKYGPTIEDRTIWKDDLYKDDPSNWGMAIATGRLIFWSEWQTSDTRIFNLLKGDNHKISCQIEYTSRQLEHLEKAEKAQQALDAF